MGASICVPPCSDMEKSPEAYQYPFAVVPQAAFSHVNGLLVGQNTVRSSSAYVRSISLVSSMPADTGVGHQNSRLKQMIRCNMVVPPAEAYLVFISALCYLTAWAPPLSCC